MLTKSRFLWLATVFELGLVVTAYSVGWIVDIDPLAHFNLETTAAVWGILGALPLYALLLLTYEKPSLRNIRDLVEDHLGEVLGSCRWYERLYLGLLAGITEEILFRGFLQPLLEKDWGWAGGLLFSNLVFALVHWITPLYGLLAGLCGLYLGVAMDMGDERNLLTPMLIHAIYDFLAFGLIAKSLKNG